MTKVPTLRNGSPWLVCLLLLSVSGVIESEMESSCSDLWKGVWNYNTTATQSATPAHRLFPGEGDLQLTMSEDEATDSILMSLRSETETLDAGCEARFDTSECLWGVLKPMNLRCDWGEIADVSLASVSYLEDFFSFWSYTVIERTTDDHSTARDPQRRELKFVAKWYEENSTEFVFLIFN